MKRLLLAALSVLQISFQVSAESRRLQVDGFADDWIGALQAYTDPVGDAADIDLLAMQVANDENSLVFHFEMADELIQQNSNDLVLYLDTDHNAGTGRSVEGIGAELVWTFGSRSGYVYAPNGQSDFVRHIDLGLRILPTHGSSHFELALDLGATPGGQVLFPGTQMRFVLRELGGDRLPDSGAQSFTLENDSLPPLPCDPLARQLVDDARIMSWNTRYASLFDGNDEDAYGRILNAVLPDVVAFQEIWDESATEVADQMNALLPSQNWTAAKLTSGNVLASRWPILDSWLIDSGYRNTAHLVDAQASSIAGPMLLINVHLRCCGADNDRQHEADSIIDFLRRVRGGSEFPGIPAQTPFVLLGDFNLVGHEQQLLTLISGDVIDESNFGPDSAPDWDGTPLLDLVSPHCGDADVYTWYSASSSYSPGRLDYVLYSNSVLETGLHTTLWTASMSAEILTLHGLQANDAAQASDHIPRLVDFRSPVPQSLEIPQLSIEFVNAQIQLSWPAVSGATSYRIQSRLSGEGWGETTIAYGTSILLPWDSWEDLRFYRIIAQN